jgi:hypothetical protein
MYTYLIYVRKGHIDREAHQLPRPQYVLHTLMRQTLQFRHRCSLVRTPCPPRPHLQISPIRVSTLVRLRVATPLPVLQFGQQIVHDSTRIGVERGSGAVSSGAPFAYGVAYGLEDGLFYL